jgi:hypothetical protein
VVGPRRRGRGAGGFDDDRFGTFARDDPRVESQPETARRTALAAMAVTGLDLGITSQENVGPNPAIPFVPVDLAWLVLVDRASRMVIVGRSATTEARHCNP